MSTPPRLVIFLAPAMLWLGCGQPGDESAATTDSLAAPCDQATWYADLDGDGVGAGEGVLACEPPADHAPEAGDCDDEDDDAYPGALEPSCGGPDLDCDGEPPADCPEACGPEDEGRLRVDPDGPEGEVSAGPTWCEGGWTLVQRSVWAWERSYLLWTDLQDWRLRWVGDPAPGEVFRLPGQAWPALAEGRELRVVHHARDGGSGEDCAPMRYDGAFEALIVDATGATLDGLGARVRIANGDELSARDHGPATDCVEPSNYGSPWFYGGCCATCPTYQSSYWSDAPHPLANYLRDTPDDDGLSLSEACPSGDALPTEFGDRMVGVNQMEVWLR